jgi:hypothetical protein
VKILISADMEGATGVTWPADVKPGTEQWQRCRRMFNSDVNAAIAGFCAGGATQVLVNEAHATMRNLLLEELDERAVLLTGRHKELSMLEGIADPDVDAVAFVGYHAGAGAEGVLAHTFLANSITGVWVNEQPAGEGPSERAGRVRVRCPGRAGHGRRPRLRRGGRLRAGGRARGGQGMLKPVRGPLPAARDHGRGDHGGRQARGGAGRPQAGCQRG